MSYGVSRRCNSDPALVWLWHRPAAASLIRPLAWETPYAASVALGKKKKKGGNTGVPGAAQQKHIPLVSMRIGV